MTVDAIGPHPAPMTPGCSDHRVRKAAWWFGAGSTLLGVAGVLVALVRPRAEVLVDGHVVGGALMAAACGLVSALLLSRMPRHPVGVTFAVIAASFGAAALTSSVTVLTSGPLLSAAAWFGAWVWVPGLLLPLTVLPLVFPDGVSGRWERLLLRADIGLVAAVAAAQATASRLHTGEHSSIGNPVALPGSGAATALVAALTAGCALASIGALLLRLSRAEPGLRRQIAPFVAAGTGVVIVVGLEGQAGRLGAPVQDLALLLIPAAAFVCITRLRLYDLEIVVRRTVVWLLLSGALIGGYVVVVQALADLLRVHGRPASVVATAVVAVAFGPVRAVLQRAVARSLYGDRDDPYAALAHTTQVLSGGADPQGALEQAATDLARGLRCPGVRVLRAGVLLAGPTGGLVALVLPLRAGDSDVGCLEVLARSAGDQFSPAERRLLADLAAPLANAVATVGLADDLRASRDQLVRAREEERRRIRADLHDGIGPALAALAVQAQVARRRVQRADDTAADVLDSLQQTALRTVGDLRRMIDELRPQALDEVGLADALRGLTEALTGDQLLVDVQIAPLPALPAAVEVAAYRVLAEALTNVRRHALAGCVAVTARVQDEQLLLQVIDNGIGPGAARRAGGVGVPSMLARVEELDGTLSVTSGSGGVGTAVDARLPLAARR